MTILETMKNEQAKTLTLNKATAFNTTGSALLDLFSTAGSLRGRENEVPLKFAKAYSENNSLAVKLAFYTRDINEGLGERDTAREMFKTLAGLNPECLIANLNNIVNFGRWDDLVYLLNTNIKNEVMDVIFKQLVQDLNNLKEGKPVSLLAKWLPSINTSSAKTRAQAKVLIEKLGITNRDYRKTLKFLRAALNVTEVSLTNKNYGNIVYPAVPSMAMNRYRNTFRRNDNKRFNKYLEEVKKGKAKINSSVLYPYDIVGKYISNSAFDPVLEEQWKALPNYVNGNDNVLIMADTSGSMTWPNGRPLATALGLAIYFAERNKGIFKGHFLTFSESPHLEKVTGNSLQEKIIHASRADWEQNTNIEAAFELILNSAIKSNTPQSEMPKTIVIVSDMEFDHCGGKEWGFYNQMKENYAKAGYQIPQIVFWNVNSLKDTFHTSANQEGVLLASGQSTSVFKTLVNTIELTPMEYMEKVLNSERYECISC